MTKITFTFILSRIGAGRTKTYHVGVVVSRGKQRWVYLELTPWVIIRLYKDRNGNISTAMEIRVNNDSFLRYPWHLMLSDMAVLIHTLLYCFCMFKYFSLVITHFMLKKSSIIYTTLLWVGAQITNSIYLGSVT